MSAYCLSVSRADAIRLATPDVRERRYFSLMKNRQVMIENILQNAWFNPIIDVALSWPPGGRRESLKKSMSFLDAMMFSKSLQCSAVRQQRCFPYGDVEGVQ